MSNTITIPKIEYQRLHKIAQQYQAARQFFTADPDLAEELVIAPRAKTSEIIKDFQETGLYNQAFLRSLEMGLKRSKTFGNKVAKEKRK